MDEENDFDDTTRFIIDQMNLHDAQAQTTMAELEKQKFTWLFQVVTIASAILGGFMLTKAERNILENIALGLLFVLIFLALLFVYIYNKRMRDVTARDSIYRKLSLYSSYKAYQLSKKEKLTKKEEAEVKKCEHYQNKVFELLDRRLSESSRELTRILKVKENTSDRYINISYVLLVGIGVAILLLIYADYII